MTRWALATALLLSVPALSATSFEAIDAPRSTITVCSSGCDYSTIQAAVGAADEGDTIELAAETFVENVRIWDKRLTIQGAGQGLTIVDGGRTESVFEFSRCQMTLADMTIQNGFSVAAGGIDSTGDESSLVVTNCEIRDNQGESAGGIRATDGTVVITSNTITENESFWAGGGIATWAEQTTIEDSVVADNRAYRYGGGIVIAGGDAVITETLIVDNGAGTGGGGVLATASDSVPTNLLIQYSSVVSNSAGYYGGGVYGFGFDGDTETVTLKNSTVSDNSAWKGAGHWLSNGLVVDSTIAMNRGYEDCGGLCGRETTVVRTIIAGNTPSDCQLWNDVVILGGFNLSSDDTCDFSGGNNLENTDPLLTPLDYYGGPTPVHGLDPASPAIDLAPDCAALDQRGVARPQDGDSDGEPLCDIGAFELEADVLIVGVDIMPRKKNNIVDLQSRRFIRVAALGSESFDVTGIDAATLRFGPKSAPPPPGTGMGLPQENYWRDVNNDGYDDLVTWFLIRDAGIACGDTSATLTGETFDGMVFEGSDRIETVGCDAGEPTGRVPFFGARRSS